MLSLFIGTDHSICSGGGCETARDEVQTIWQAAEEGFAEVLAMVRNYREELKGMRGEACARSFVRIPEC